MANQDVKELSMDEILASIRDILRENSESPETGDWADLTDTAKQSSLSRLDLPQSTDETEFLSEPRLKMPSFITEINDDKKVDEEVKIPPLRLSEAFIDKCQEQDEAEENSSDERDGHLPPQTVKSNLLSRVQDFAEDEESGYDMERYIKASALMDEELDYQVKSEGESEVKAYKKSVSEEKKKIPPEVLTSSGEENSFFHEKEVADEIIRQFAQVFQKREKPIDTTLQELVKSAVINEVVPVLSDWLTKKMPHIVRKEIERVMVKAGKN